MLKIRQIRQEDNSAVKDLISSIMSDEFIDSARAYTTDDLENTCEHYNGKHEIFYVAEISAGQIVGTVGIKNDAPHTALLRRLFIRKEFRRKGYGSQLLQQAFAFCKLHGYKKIIFRGADAMSAAYKTCLRNGFIEEDILLLPHTKIFVLKLNI